MDPSTQSVFEIGAPLGGYVITQRLGQGGMCEVFKGLDPVLNRYVAIKVMLSEMQTEEALSNFLEEARVIANMRHSNIVPLYSVGQVKGIPWLAMGFIEGPNLEMYLYETGPFNLEEARAFMRQASSALAYATKSGVIHLDIKPANFIMDQDKLILLADFGVARRMSQDYTGSELFGTPAYASPEHIRQDHPDLRTDIYCLGVTLFQMITGELPYLGDEAEEVCRAHLFSPFPSGVLEHYGIPIGWSNFIQRMMEKKPEDRFQSYGELQEALESIDRFTQVKKRVVEAAPSEGRHSLPRTGGSPDDLFFLIPEEMVKEGEHLFRLGMAYEADAVFETLNNRWPILKVNNLAKRLLELQSHKGEDLNDTFWALARIPQFEQTVNNLSDFMAADAETEVETQEERLEIIGLDRARNLALVARCLTEDWQSERPFNHHNYWEHVIYTGVLAGFMVDMLGLNAGGLEFACGIVHDIGKLVLMELYPAKTVALWMKAYELNQPMDELEAEFFGTTHHEVGAEWLRKSGFMKQIFYVTETQSQPELCYEEIQKTNTLRLLSTGKIKQTEVETLALVTACANILAKELGFGYDGSPYLDQTPWIEQENTERLFEMSTQPNITMELFKKFFTESCMGLPELPITQMATAQYALLVRNQLENPPQSG